MLSPSTDRGRVAGATAARSAIAKPAGRGHLTVTRPRRAFVYRERGCGPSPGSPRPAARFLLRAPLLNLVPNVPAPKCRTPEEKTVRAVGIGCRRRDRASEFRVLIGGGWWLSGPHRAVPPSPEGDLEDAGAAGGAQCFGACPAEAPANPEPAAPGEPRWDSAQNCAAAGLPLPALSSLRW